LPSNKEPNRWDFLPRISLLTPRADAARSVKEREPLLWKCSLWPILSSNASRATEKGISKPVLDIEYRGKNISDVLDMTINQAIEFFSEVNGSQEKRIIKRLKPLQDVGLGYIKLGQSSSTLSGGENQRVKLAFFLSNEKQESTLFIFDEPTTGLHFHDINTLRLISHADFLRPKALKKTVLILYIPVLRLATASTAL